MGITLVTTNKISGEMQFREFFGRGYPRCGILEDTCCTVYQLGLTWALLSLLLLRYPVKCDSTAFATGDIPDASTRRLL